MGRPPGYYTPPQSTSHAAQRWCRMTCRRRAWPSASSGRAASLSSTTCRRRCPGSRRFRDGSGAKASKPDSKQACVDADRKRAQTPSHKQRAHEGTLSPATVAFVENNGRFGRRREEARAQTPIGEGAIHPQAVAKGVPDLGRFGLHRRKQCGFRPSCASRWLHRALPQERSAPI